jgi:hypothetical protein
MKRSLHFGLLVTLSIAIQEPLCAAAISEDPAARPFRQSESMATLAPAQVSPDRPWKAGNETATLPWSAPVGHHQPRAIDLPTSRQILDEEDAKLDRKIGGICRGC